MLKRTRILKNSRKILQRTLLSAVFLFLLILPQTAIGQTTTPATSTPALPTLPTLLESEAMVRYFFADNPAMVEVAKCESGFRQYKADGSPLLGSNRYIGVFQIYEKVHSAKAASLGFDLATLEGNLAYAKYTYQQSGLAPWKGCVKNGSSLAAATTSSEISDRLKGYILLQVEQSGEAWYVKPDNSKRYYLKDGQSAYEMMRSFGLGVTNENLAKIPVGVESRFNGSDADEDGLDDKLEEGLGTDAFNADSDNDGKSDGQELQSGLNPLGDGMLEFDAGLINSLKGKILLQVEKNGEAWYVDPRDGKRYYLKDGEAAYEIMRYLSLGINNSDLSQIAAEEF